MNYSKTKKNYTKVLASLNFPFPGLPKIPRAPDATSHRDLVDVYVAKKRLQLVHLLPVFDLDAFRFTHVEESFEQCEKLDRNYVANLLAAGYYSVVDELNSLIQDEEPLLQSTDGCPKTGRVRVQSFVENKPLFDEFVEGLKQCSEAEKSDTAYGQVRTRKTLGEKMVGLGDFWLARQMFSKCFSYLEYYEDDDLDQIRVELWCLLSYLCIYYEFDPQIGYNLPTKCLSLAQQVCRDKDSWKMDTKLMNIFITKAIYVYGLRIDWDKIKGGLNWHSMYLVATVLLHVLYVKKARYWQNELEEAIKVERSMNNVAGTEKIKSRTEWIKGNVLGALTTAMGYADESENHEAFLATTLRRGLFLEQLGDWEMAMEDFNAIHVLAENFEEKETLAIALNRIGHNHKKLGNVAVALDYFEQERELSLEENFEELQADALKDMGFVLLEEGYSWEADECMAQAKVIFEETKKPDTPNDLDDLTWAMLGVTGGQHILGRFTTLIRTQERSNIKAIYEWKMLRKSFPIASMPQKWYKAEKRRDFENQYADIIPKRGSKRNKVVFDVTEEENEEERRYLFEFRPSEVRPRPTTWLLSQGYDNMFGFINASDKPRVVPRFSLFKDLDDDVSHALPELHEGIDDDDEISHERKRARLARRMTLKMSQSMTKAGSMRKSQREMSTWLRHDFRVKSWRKKSQSVQRWKIMTDPAAGMGERLTALLDDMKDISGLDYEDRDDYGFAADVDDESDDTELGSKKVSFKKPSMNPELREEFANFDEKQLGF